MELEKELLRLVSDEPGKKLPESDWSEWSPMPFGRPPKPVEKEEVPI